jgi:hypothetical protein
VKEHAVTATAQDATTITAPEAAKKLGVEPKVFRRFLRATGVGVGQGNRYALDPKSLPKLKIAFAKWNTEQEAKRAARDEEKAKTEIADEGKAQQDAERPAEGLPKAEQAKAAHRRTRKAASEKNRQPAES